MQTTLLTRNHPPKRPALTVLKDIDLDLGRVHECAGRARRVFALILAARTNGPVLWIAPAYGIDKLNPDGMLRFVDPGRFIFVAPQRAEDLLWSMEEALRSGAVPLVVADMPGFPGLTPVRRLHLAAEAGAAQAPRPPLGLLLTPDAGGAQGVETRWVMQPDMAPDMAKELPHDHLRWHLARSRARRAAPRDWHILQTPTCPFQIAP
ncbi:MAG: hypothetical protein HN582_03665 [Marinovum sp.]|nr:hypothetical protein [Marinovum sp.]MBT7906570.1 hypothetical protein [Marinovum sp.]